MSCGQSLGGQTAAGLHSAPKHDLDSSAELVLGQTARVQGEFLPSVPRLSSSVGCRPGLQGEAKVFSPVAVRAAGL